VTDIVVVKGDPSPEEVAALTVALLAVATASRCPAQPRSGHRRPPAAVDGPAVVPPCGCA
jgi:hypothetical protein